jgi:hypothetical protein
VERVEEEVGVADGGRLVAMLSDYSLDDCECVDISDVGVIPGEEELATGDCGVGNVEVIYLFGGDGAEGLAKRGGKSVSEDGWAADHGDGCEVAEAKAGDARVFVLEAGFFEG